MPLIKNVLHPAAYTVDHSLSGVQAHAILRLRTRVTQSRDSEKVPVRYRPNAASSGWSYGCDLVSAVKGL